MGTDVSIQVRNEVLERKKNGCHLQDDGREMNSYSNFIGRLFIENTEKSLSQNDQCYGELLVSSQPSETVRDKQEPIPMMAGMI